MLKTLAKALQLAGGSSSNKHKVTSSGDISKFTACAPNIEQTPSDNKTVRAKCLKKDARTKKCLRRTNLSIKRSVHTQSCLTPDALKLLVNAWNAEYPDQKIVFKPPLTKVWETLRDKITKHIPLESGEHAWLEQDWVHKALTQDRAEKLKDTLYRPDAPDSWKTNPTTWLSTNDIEETLSQYETKYPGFKFYGASPIDFALKNDDGSCAVNSLCRFNLAGLIKNRVGVPVDYIGAVFNLDKHDQSGSHWISMFINIPRQEINFWDSFAFEPPAEVRKLMDKIRDQGKDIGLKLKIQANKRQHQYKNTECGVYSINFIVQQLEGKSFQNVCRTIIHDDKMNQMRKRYFSVN